MEENGNKRIAVLGAGIVGLNCAVELQARGYQVTLIDKIGIGEGCSKGNAGHFATEQVFPMAEMKILWQLPKMLLDPLGPVALSPKYLPKLLPWFAQFIGNMAQSKRRKNTQALKSLNKNAIEYYKPLLAAADAQYLLIEKGSLLVFEKTPLKKVTLQYQAYLEQDVEVKLLNKEETLSLEPNLHKNIQYSLYFPNVAHTISPLELSKKLAEHAKNLGCTFEKTEIETISHSAKRVEVSTGNDNSFFDHIVIATGAWSKVLLQQLNYKLPLEGERGYSSDLSAQTRDYLSRPVASAERRFIMTPMSHGLRLAGTVEFASLATKANMKRASMLRKNAQYILANLPELTNKMDNAWLGVRPSLPDSLPVIGRAPNHKNITLALGHHHLGLTLGAVTGKLVGQIIANEKTDVDITPFCLSRFNK